MESWTDKVGHLAEMYSEGTIFDIELWMHLVAISMEVPPWEIVKQLPDECLGIVREYAKDPPATHVQPSPRLWLIMGSKVHGNWWEKKLDPKWVVDRGQELWIECAWQWHRCYYVNGERVQSSVVFDQ